MKKIITAGALILTMAGGVAIGSQAALVSQASEAPPEAQMVSDAAAGSYARINNCPSHTHSGEWCRLGEDCPEYDNSHHGCMDGSSREHNGQEYGSRHHNNQHHSGEHHR